MTKYSSMGEGYIYSQIRTVIESTTDLFDGLDTLTVKRAISWLPEHMTVFNRFMEEAQRAKGAGYAIYSARAIWHYLRHLHQTDPDTRHIKLTNIVTPGGPPMRKGGAVVVSPSSGALTASFGYLSQLHLQSMLCLFTPQ